MELSDLAIFATVARCGGITRAAGELNTVQSNVTARIKLLEAEIGSPLFERHSRGVVLTGAGRRLLPYAERFAVLSKEAVAAARDDGVPKGPFALGSMETTAAVRLPPLLARYHAAYPLVQLALQTGPTATLVTAVLDGELEAAFVAGPVEHPDLAAETVYEEELVLVTAGRWTSLAALRAGTPEAGPTALAFRTGCSYRQRLEQVLASFGWVCPARLEFGTLDGILGCVGADMGVTLLPRIVVERCGQTANVRAHALDKHLSHIKTLLIRRKAGHESSALAALRAGMVSAGRADSTPGPMPRRVAAVQRALTP
jgi:DNA-binding transcriptional LysR family regulator